MLPLKLQKEIELYYKKNFSAKKFLPGKTRIPHAGKVFDEKELNALIEACLDGWWTEGRFAQEFEKKFAKYLDTKYVTLVNSGSSANLVAFMSLTSKVFKERAIKPGDEVITSATAFPTTVNPIIQAGCVPVFVDNDIETGNITAEQIKKAMSKKTKAIMVAHTLGNPIPLDEILKIVKKNKLWLIEDCCDALGSTYDGKMLGTFGDVATFSFYPAHHITMGEGGAIVTKNPLIHRSIRQFRDWGRDCWCDTGKDNTCRKRFAWKMGLLPYGYDHKFIYSQIGYNLKLTDMQPALGLAQLEKLDSFIKKRNENFRRIFRHMKKYEKYFILPKWEKKASPSWFGFLLTIKDNAPFKRLDIINFLEKKNIATRTLFSGNLLRHPAYMNIKHRKVGSLKNSDKFTNDAFWIGVYPGIKDEMLKFILKSFDDFFIDKII
ncbi:MAG: lipopolysaccharide biosynthesis protein RfbH [Candidatus Levybacteria bacterium]|nr:lipopolysaccharide biosynthesis protein RfbH [Candidatus Levybacteria bacterium]